MDSTKKQEPLSASTHAPSKSSFKKGSPEYLAELMTHKRTPVEQVPSIFDAPSDPTIRRELPTDAIKSSPFQRRTMIDPEHVQALAASITADGLLQDILVRELPDGTYELVAGENRLAAHRLLSRSTIPAIVRVMSDPEAARALTLDNIQHKALTDFEVSLHFKMLYDAGYIATDEDMAALIGKSRSYVTKTRSFSDLPSSAIAVLMQNPDAIGYETASRLRASGLMQEEPELIAAAIKEVADSKIKQSNAIAWIQSQRKSREGKTKEETLLSDLQFVHKRKKVRIVVKSDSFQIAAKGIDGESLKKMVMERLDELLGQ